MNYLYMLLVDRMFSSSEDTWPKERPTTTGNRRHSPTMTALRRRHPPRKNTYQPRTNDYFAPRIKHQKQQIHHLQQLHYIKE